MENYKRAKLGDADIYTFSPRRAEKRVRQMTLLAIILGAAWLFDLIYQMNQFAHWLDRVFFV